METELLKCKLTTVQITERGQRLAAIREEASRIAEEKKAMNDVYKSRMSDLAKEANTLAREINEKAERREVEVVEERDFAAKEARTIRVDTDEVIRTRVLTPEELARPPLFDFDDNWRQARNRSTENETKVEVATRIGFGAIISEAVKRTYASDEAPELPSEVKDYFQKAGEDDNDDAPELPRSVEGAVENQAITETDAPKKPHWRARKKQREAERAAQANKETN